MPHIAVVLVEPAFDETIGLIARAMKNFGLKDLRLVQPVSSPGQKASMRAVHAQDVFRCARKFETLEDALADTGISVGTTAQQSRSTYKMLRRPVTPVQLAEKLTTMNGRVGMVFGREGTGLTNRELDRCDVIMTIPSSPEYRTLNISHAAAIIFYELYNSSYEFPTEVLAGAEVKRRILEYVQTVSTAVNTSDAKKSLTIRAFKGAFGRAALRRREASLIAGFFRKVSASLANPAEKEKLCVVTQGNVNGDSDNSHIIG